MEAESPNPGSATTAASTWQTQSAFLAAAFVLWIVNFAIWFPGTLNNDSVGQYAQSITGRFTDWQPPIMAALWAAVRPLVPAPWPMFALNLTLYWLGFTLIGHVLQQRGRWLLAYAVLLSGASPLLVYFNRFMITDVGLASALIAAFGMIFWMRARGKRGGIVFWTLTSLTLAYAALVRGNGVFAVAPVALYAIGFESEPGRVRWWAASIGLAAVLLAGTMAVNHRTIGAANTDPIQRLEIFDVVGIAHHSGDTSSVKAAGGNNAAASSLCYTPLSWDRLATAKCGRLQALPSVEKKERVNINRLWFAAILAHPLAYAQHRLRHFNAELMFLVPAAEQCVAAPEMHECGTWSNARPDIRIQRSDYLLKSVLVWPVTWLVLGLAAVFIGKRQGRTALTSGSQVLLASGLFYALAYLVVGIAVNVRYFLWTVMAVQTGIIIGLAEPTLIWRKRDTFIIAVPLTIMVFLGYVWRLADVRLFLLD